MKFFFPGEERLQIIQLEPLIWAIREVHDGTGFLDHFDNHNMGEKEIEVIIDKREKKEKYKKYIHILLHA